MINVPNEVLFDTHMSADEATVFARKMVALGYYTQNNISMGYCAEIAGMTEEEFMIFLGQNKVDIYSFDSDTGQISFIKTPRLRLIRRLSGVTANQ